MLQMSKTKDDVDPETYYDYITELSRFDILSSYEISSKSRGFFVLNSVCVVILGILYVYVIAAGTYGLFTPNHKTLKTQGFFQVSVLLCSVLVRLSYRSARDSVYKGSDFIRSGIYTYNDLISTEYMEIKKKRVATLRKTITFFTSGLFISGVSNIVTPFLPILLGKRIVNDDGCINPYLPLHICSPFDNTKSSEYAIEFFVYSVLTVTMYSPFVSHEKICIGAVLQITSELEILQYSLDNIARRALDKLKQSNTSYSKNVNKESLFELPEYQHYMYSCLVENILHYNAILRLRALTYKYVERAVTSCIIFFAILMAVSIIALLEEKRPELILVIDLFGFFPVCYIGQILYDQSNELMYSVYSTPWADCDKKFKTGIKLFMCNTLKPIVIQPKGIDAVMNYEAHANLLMIGYKMVNVMR